ncbi:FUSC family protein [Agrococcus sp. Marseille-P2731]|uniref:FUSC family protein n=1 Tax=Agrococcus sp. Marseille-P2731 TaxID=1841862 RepID=UPI00092FF91D|nr:hypothetical protein [Agrococcus sp. Marseille-P2731]
MTAPRVHSLDPSDPADAARSARVRRFFAAWFPPDRVVNALRAAAAAMGAFLVGTLLPGDMSEYAYAAALGAFVAIGTNLFSIARAALQQIVALAIGAAIGLALFNLDIPALVKIGIIAAISVLLPGARTLGAGASYVPVAALLVIMFGRIDPDGYAVAYVGQFSLGLVVGVIVNAIARPPLYDRQAHERLRLATRSLADRVEALTDQLRGEWPPDRRDWLEWGSELEVWIADLEDEMSEARESQRLNPRTLWRSHDLTRDRDELAALRAVVHRMIDVIDTVSSAAWGTPIEVHLDESERALTADALAALEAHLRSWVAEEGVADASIASGVAIDALYAHAIVKPEPDSGAAGLVFSLRAMRERIDRVASAS